MPRNNRNSNTRNKSDENVAPLAVSTSDPAALPGPDESADLRASRLHRGDRSSPLKPIENTLSGTDSPAETGDRQTIVESVLLPPASESSPPWLEGGDDETIVSSTHSELSLEDKYRLRSTGQNSVYDELEEVMFCKPLFAGNTNLSDIVVTTDRRGNTNFLRDGSILQLMVFGEVAPRLQGTRITARGDKRPVNDPIELHDRIKHRFVLRMPSYPTSEVAAAWHAQNHTILGLYDMAEMALKGTRDSVERMGFFDVGDVGVDIERLPLITDTPIYVTLSRPAALEQRDNPGPTLKQARADVSYPISPRTTYSANVLEDHSGPQFEYHQAAKLVQRENYDIGKELVLPWKVNYVYRPGTLVMAMVTFKVWNLDKRVYRATMIKIRVLAESPEEEEDIFAPPPSDSSGYEVDKRKAQPDFDDVEVRAAKRRKREVIYFLGPPTEN